MKVLFIGNTTSSAHNLKKGLSKYKDVERIDIMFDEKPVLSGRSSSSFLEPRMYDIVHLSYPFFVTSVFSKKFEYVKKAKVLICHWRGTDLRGKKYNNAFKQLVYNFFHMLNKKYFFKKADYHIYSTMDLKWWVRNINDNKKELFRTPIDCDLFKPMNNIKSVGAIDFTGGGKSYSKHKIKHDDMPLYLNQFNYAICKTSEGLDVKLMSCIIKECLACGLKVKYHEEKDRDWVIKHASINVMSEKLYNLYKRLLKKESVNE